LSQGATLPCQYTAYLEYTARRREYERRGSEIRWGVLLLVLALMNGICIAADRLPLRRHKTRLYYALLSWWLRIEKTRVRDYHRLVAASTLSQLHRLLHLKGSYVLGAIVAVGLSLSLTTVAVSFAGLAAHAFEVPPVQVYLINLFFDAATIAVTAKLLTIILRTSSRRALALVACDLVAAFLLGVLCLVSFVLLQYFFSSSINPIDWSYLGEYILLILRVVAGGRNPHLIAFASTTLIPTGAYMAFFTILLVCKPILKLARAASLLFLERALEVKTPEEIAVFSLTGSVITVLALASGLLAELL